MENLPSNWKNILKQSNLMLARRELAEFFKMMIRDAKAEGKEAYIKSECIAGWEEFAENPCYETAVDWLKSAPEYAPIIFQYFQGSCPGGMFYDEGIDTASSFALGEYSLNMSISSLNNLKEISEQEYKLFPAGIKDGTVYHAPTTKFARYDWEVMLAATEGRVYKIAASLELENLSTVADKIQSIFKLCELRLGTPSEEKHGLYIWDTEDGNVIFQTGVIMELVALNLYVTAGRMAI